MKFKKILAVVSATALCISLSACAKSGESTADSKSSEASGTAAAVSVTLAESWDFSSGFYPVITGSKSTNYGITYWTRNFYNTLVCYDDKGEIQGELAEKWEVSEDSLVYTFTLRDGVKFSDGTPLTAADVKTSFEASIKNLEIYNGSFGKLSSIITAMEALDDKTFVMTLSQPYYGTLNDLTMCNPMGVVNPAELNEDLTPKESFSGQTAGTGPYMYAGDFDGTTYTFVRNPHYWGEAPELDNFKIKVIEDNDAKILALRSKEIDAVIGSSRMSYDAYGELSGDSAFSTAVDDSVSRTRYLGLNLSKAPFNDENVRKAVAYALDQETLCETIFQGIELPAETLFSKEKPFCDVEQTTYALDIEKAKSLLNEAGWVDSDGDGVREKDGQKLEYTLSYTQTIGSVDDAVLAIAGELDKIGFKITPSGADMMTWFGAIGAGEYEITLYQTYGGAYDPTTVMTNINPDVSTDPIAMQVSSVLEGGNALLAEMNTTTDTNRVQEIYAQVLETISEKCLLVPISNPREFAVWNNETISGFDFYPDSNYVNAADIHLK